jgi:hypothetical protein
MRVRNRRETRALLDMNDSQLADIGLTRDDVRHALRQPLTHDPWNLPGPEAARASSDQVESSDRIKMLDFKVLGQL